MADSQLDLVIAGTVDAILMIEGFCDFLSDEQMLQAVQAGHAAVGVACTAISEWRVHTLALPARARVPTSPFMR
jgi:polyribonucleotide nucleotidyltransferase